MSNNECFDFKFYKWEKKFHDRPFLRQPFAINGKSTLGLRQGKWQENLPRDSNPWASG